MTPTIYDVAERAGVSLATVSRVLNNPSRVSEKTRLKVQEAIRELNYHQNLIASALMTNKTDTIGLLVPDVSNPFFAEVARAVEDRAHGAGLNVVICNTDDAVAKEAHYIELLRQKRVDGVILAPTNEDPKAVAELAATIPTVLVSRDVPGASVNAIFIDDYEGAWEAVTHLADLGHRHIGMISEASRHGSSARRVEGYRAALRQAERARRDGHGRPTGQARQARPAHQIGEDDPVDGMAPVQPDVAEAESSTLAGGIAAMECLLDRAHPPTAVFAANDLLAIGAMHAIRRRGGSVPEDVSIVGFDGTVLASVVDPPLTTVAQPTAEMGRTAVELLERMMIEDELPPRRMVLRGTLRVGRSSTKLRSSGSFGENRREKGWSG